MNSILMAIVLSIPLTIAASQKSGNDSSLLKPSADLKNPKMIQDIYAHLEKDEDFQEFKNKIPKRPDNLNINQVLRDDVDQALVFFHEACGRRAVLEMYTQEEIDATIQSALAQIGPVDIKTTPKDLFDLYMILIRWDEKERAFLAWLLLKKNRLENLPERTSEQEQELQIKQDELQEHARLTKKIFNNSDPESFLYNLFVGEGYIHQENFVGFLDAYAQTGGDLKL
jgi:hypothetical protein